MMMAMAWELHGTAFGVCKSWVGGNVLYVGKEKTFGLGGVRYYSWWLVCEGHVGDGDLAAAGVRRT